jgi:hypothetical protein
MLRKIAFTGATKAVRSVASSKASNAAFARAFSTTLSEKERGDEARYFRDLDAQKKAEIRANLEKLLAQDERTEEKAEVLSLLTTKVEEEKGIIGKLGLDDWKFALPIGIILGVPAISNEVLVLSAETQLLAVFILSLSTLYTQGGGMIAKALDDYSKDIHNKLKKVDENILSEVHATIKANEKLLTLEQDVSSIHKLVDDMTVAQADILNYTEEHRYRDAIVKKLDALVALEDTVAAAVRARMVTKVKADVVETFTSDKKAKEAALDHAVAVLLAGTTGKRGADVVGGAFSSAIKSYKDAYAKLPADKDEILVQLQKDIAAIAVAPTVDATGGNVYETHPIVHA